jgi:hypothetical protein
VIEARRGRRQLRGQLANRIEATTTRDRCSVSLAGAVRLAMAGGESPGGRLI